MRLGKIYLTWLAVPMALLLAGGVLMPERDARRSERPRDAAIGTKKVRRSLKFHALARGGLDDTPLHTINRPGLTIDLAIDPATYEHMLIRGVRNLYKRRSTDVAVRFGERLPCPAVLRLRGASSLKRGPRLNFAINLLRPEMLTPEIELKRFYLMNMVSDPLEFKLEFACRLLQARGLFPPHHQYVKVLVNGEPQGMFMLVERPRNAIKRVHPGTVSVYRRGRGVYRPQWSKSVPAVKQQMEALERLTRETDREHLAKDLARLIDLDAFMIWTGVNSILRNGDTVDELFLYEVREDRNRPAPMRFMAWDYDEIMAEGWSSRLVPNPLMYARRTSLALLLHDDPELRARYRATLKRLLTGDLTIESLVDLLRKVQADRDRLDDGLSQQVQDENRRLRETTIDKFESDLRARHAILLQSIGNDDA